MLSFSRSSHSHPHFLSFFLPSMCVQVQLVMFGSMLLIWCHLIWLVALVISLERNRAHHLVVKRAKSVYEAEELASKGNENIHDNEESS